MSCPCEALSARALEIRKAPLLYKDQLEDAAELEEDIQRYADILKQGIGRRAAF